MACFLSQTLSAVDSSQVKQFLPLISPDTPCFVVLNKVDLIRTPSPTLLSPLSDLKHFFISCADHTGIDSFLSSLEEAVKSR
jgi:50S ribosomal subunit-associated GTPase HflX